MTGEVEPKKTGYARLLLRIEDFYERAIVKACPQYKAVRIGRAVSLCSLKRLRRLSDLAQRVASSRIEGDFVECGVFQGGSAVVIADRLMKTDNARQAWLFDVFSGMPNPGEKDPPEAWTHAGKYESSEQIVQATLKKGLIPLERVNIIRGLYEDTLPSFQPPSIVFLHLDCDWYTSVQLCLNKLFDRVVPGGAIVFDDYGYWSGCRKAVDEFLASRDLDIKLIPIDYTSHYFIR